MENKQKMSTEPYKGVRDFFPEDMAVQNYIFSIWKKVAEKYGYEEYSASILEYADLYRSKGKGSEEIVNEQMYVFKDKGDREVALRPEMTPTLARMIASKRKALKFPLRWFSIPNVFRYERPQRGRKREHWQLNCDLMGVVDNDPINAEVEIIKLAHEIMTKGFGADEKDFEIRINDRRILLSILKDEMLLNETETINFIRILDKHGKISQNEFLEELHSLVGVEKVKKFFELTDISIKEKEDSSLKKNPVFASNLIELGKRLEKVGIKNSAYYKYLSRGFDYYTGMVFEVFDTNPENRRSLFGGGRYDNLLEMFGVEPVPTVGFGMGDVTIRDFLVTHKLLPSNLKPSQNSEE
jgi:histidyl-tRNA synthetase